jgi:energy-coupling factor transporter transmembrane protein EcfT
MGKHRLSGGSDFSNATMLTNRLQLFSESPIETGVFLAMLMPWVAGAWKPGLGTGKFQRGMQIAATILWFFMLAGVSLTYSRGPVTGMLAGALVFLVYARMSQWRRWRALLFGMTGGLCLMAVLLLLSPAGIRFAPNFIVSDASVANRWELWKGASQMIFIRPWNGIGTGEGGFVFSQWFQPEHLDYVYTSLLNSWLEIGVESGLPALSVCIFSCMLAQGLVWARLLEVNGTGPKKPEMARRWTFASVPAAASLATLMVCGMTSSVHNYKGVPWMLAANVVVLAACGVSWRRQVRWRRLLAVSAGITCLALAGLWTFSASVSSEYAMKISIAKDGVVRLEKKQARHDEDRSLAVLCDRNQLGRLYGKRLREMLNINKRYDMFVIPDPRRLLPEPKFWLPADGDVAAFGRSVTLLAHVPPKKGRTCYLVHPEGIWTAENAGVRRVVWHPLYDLDAERDDGQAGDDLIELRISSSLGGACDWDVIKQAKGFFW